MPGTGPLGVDATYADLMTLADAHLRIAAAQMGAQPIVSLEDARHATRMVHELVHALGSQARVLAGPAIRTRAVINSPRPDPVSLAAARFTQALERAVYRRPQQPELVSSGSLARHYKNAAVAVRTATDLLLTQVGLDGRSRTPDAHQLLSPHGRVVALDQVAGLTAELAATRQLLHQQVRRHANSRHRIEALPDMAAVRETARDVQTLAVQILDDDPALLQIASLQPTRRQGEPMPIRTPDPVDELRIRIERLRQSAWQMISGEEAAPLTRQALAAFANVGAAVNTTAAVAGARLAGKDVRDPRLPQVLQARLAKADAWRGVREGLLQLHTTEPLDRIVMDEAHDLLRLVARMVPAERGTGTFGRREWEPRIYQALSNTTELLDQIAGWNSQALSQEALRGRVYTPGRRLTGEQVTDDPELVAAKLANKPVAAPDTTIAAIRERYRLAAASMPNPVGRSPAGPVSAIQPPGL